MASRLDIILFGASGFTGKYCIPVLHKVSKAHGRLLSWGIAGRSEQKLKAVLEEFQKKIGDDLSAIPIIIADVNDYESMKKMTAQAKVVINCSGPYRFYGEPVIKACIETGTHQVDVSGEPQFMESMQLNYHKAAQEKGVYIVSACGFDSIPADLGLVYLQRNFEGTLNSVETYLQISGDANTSGPSINYTTWESAVHGVAHAAELSAIRRKLYPTRLPSFKPKLESRSNIHKSDVIDTWCMPFLGSDRSVMMRSQRYFCEVKKQRPVQVNCYFGLNSFMSVVLMVIFGTIFNFLVKYEFGRNLLLKHPKLFSCGLFSFENPSEETVKKSKFSVTLDGKGWSEKLSDSNDEYTTPPNKSLRLRVSGTNPGYGFTCAAVTLSAIVTITETDKLPENGGVYPPAAAFADTSLINQLQENDFNFEIITDEK